jgi:hypothetical protein
MNENKSSVILRPARPAAQVGKASATSSLIAGPVEKNDTFGLIQRTETLRPPLPLPAQGDTFQTP